MFAKANLAEGGSEAEMSTPPPKAVLPENLVPFILLEVAMIILSRLGPVFKDDFHLPEGWRFRQSKRLDTAILPLQNFESLRGLLTPKRPNIPLV